MIEKYGDCFDEQADAICITTNGFVKKNGENVMGKGCAKAASLIFPELPKILGDKILMYGNNVHELIKNNNTTILSFPVKPQYKIMESPNDVVRHMRNKFKIGDSVPGWACVADIEIISNSAHQLLNLTNERGWGKVVLPRPGCGAGELEWESVKVVLDDILDDRFVLMTLYM